MLRRFKKDNEALIGILAIVFILGIVIFGVMIWAIVDMLTKNILPICIGIAIVIAIPIVAKGWYYKKTKQEYKSEGGLLG
jgi:hypothetical protein